MKSARERRHNDISSIETISPLASLQQQISESAYYKAEARGFSPDGELEDWLSAEVEVNSSEEVYLS